MAFLIASLIKLWLFSTNDNLCVRPATFQDRPGKEISGKVYMGEEKEKNDSESGNHSDHPAVSFLIQIYFYFLYRMDIKRHYRAYSKGSRYGDASPEP